MTKTEAVVEPSAYEQTLFRIIRTLPIERLLQVLDYTRYIQSQTGEDFEIVDADETAEEILARATPYSGTLSATKTTTNRSCAHCREIPDARSPGSHEETIRGRQRAQREIVAGEKWTLKK